MAVYTHLEESDIQEFLAHYHAGVLVSCKGIAEGIENTNYLLVTETVGISRKYILTIYERRVNPSDLPFFLGLTEWLSDRGIVCPKPVRGQDGETVYQLKGKSAALIQFLEGRGNPHITARHMELVGEMIARMHLAAEGFPLVRRNALSLDGWQALYMKCAERIDEIASGLRREMSQELDFLTDLWPRNLPSGIIHADIFPDNVFFIDGHTNQPELSGVIDFYFACNDYWVYDLIVCMNAWCFNQADQFVLEHGRALLRAYDRVRPITSEERRAIPILARGAALRFLLTRAHDLLFQVDGALVTPKNPLEYQNKLRFHQQVVDYRDYGLP